MYISSLPSLVNIEEIEASETSYMSDRMAAIAQRQGNPEGIELKRLGSAVCLYSQTMSWPSFNTVKGIREEHIQHLDEIIDFYESRGRNPHIEIVPALSGSALLRALQDKGFYCSGNHASLYCTPETSLTAIDNMPLNMEIRSLERDEFETYARIHCLGTGLPESGIHPVARNNEVLYDRPGWSFFIGYWGGRPAGAGVLHAGSNTASLTFAAVLPEYRRLGFHQQLLRRRIEQASQKGCSMVVGQCAFLSQSHRNMERAGMKIGYIRSHWRKTAE